MNPSIKSNTDYSNTIIYKITCKDPAITDLYVGHTTNFVQRKNAHMYSCISPKTANHKCKLYETIRSNGGWSNWRMDIIAFFECDDLYAARTKEQEYYVSLKATLNSIEPLPLPKEKRTQTNQVIRDISNKCKYVCTICNYRTSRLIQYNKHILTPTHQLNINDNKNGKTYENCNTVCANQILPSNDTLITVDTYNVLYDLLKEVRVTNKEMSAINKQNIDTQTQILECMKAVHNKSHLP